MKKKILLAIVGLSIFSGVALAQSIKYGVKAGINVSRITLRSITLLTTTIDGLISTNSRVGFNGGGFVNFGLGNNVSVQPELSFSQFGGKRDVAAIDPITGDKITTASNYNFDYLTLPVVFKYNFPQRFSIYLGPQLGFLLTAKSKMIEKVNGTTVREEEEDGKKVVKSTDFAGIIGAEYSFPMGIVLSARYQLGLTNLDKDNDASKPSNNALNFTVGYTFGK